MKFQNEKNLAYSGTEELWLIDKCLQKYNLDIATKISREIMYCRNILEFGAGIGSIASLVQNITKKTIDCIEIDPLLYNFLISKNFKCYQQLNKVDIKYDAVYSSNVFEHIENDQDYFMKIREVLNKDGVLIIYVPAFQILYSDIDKQVGHVRRYHKSDLCQKLVKSGFIISNSYYVDSIGFFVWLALKLFPGGGSQMSEKKLVAYDKIFYPISQLFDKLGLRNFIGKNLMVIAKKSS